MAALICVPLWGPSAGAATLPDPLTLEAALERAEAPHPSVAEARANVDIARAELQSAKALGAVNVSAAGRLRWVEPPDLYADLGRDDHKASLILQKNLYDFGRRSALEEAASADIRASNWRYEDVVTGRRVRIMRAFFDVLLADLEFARDNEDMAVVYVSLDKLRDRHELGEVSDIQLLKQESEYQSIRRKRAQSENRQRTSRARLAQLLNVPDQLPSNLVRPDLPQVRRKPPEFEPIFKRVRQTNPVLKALQADVAAARARLAAARASGNPTLNAEAETSAYSRELGSSDRWRAGISLEVPLYTGGRVDAAVARQRARLNRALGAARQAEYDIRQRVLELVMKLQALDVQKDEAWAQRDYRELYLDRSRAVYEMEVKTDLGDAMVRLSEAELTQARTEFEIALAWERLKALAGGHDPRAHPEETDAQ